jgi:WD40 repeat protein
MVHEIGIISIVHMMAIWRVCRRKYYASCHGNRTVMVWLSATGALVRVLRGHMRSVWCATFHPRHSDLIATACLGDLVLVWHKVRVWRVA